MPYAARLLVAGHGDLSLDFSLFWSRRLDIEVLKMAQPHQSLSVTAKHRLNPQPPRQTAPAITERSRVSRTEVAECLLTAMNTLRDLPDREKRFFIVKSFSPDYVREYMDAYIGL